MCTENVIRVDDVMGSPKLADYPDVVCKTRQNGALKHALNDRCWREADIELKGGARRRLVDSATLGVDDINGG